MSQAGQMESYGIDADHGSQDGKSHRRRNSMELFPPQMTNKMKGLFKGLRYISQIFEPNEKEREMQIGLPTDVKHVAHIGWDGPSVTAPTWMSEFKSGPDLSSRRLGAFGGENEHHDPALATSEVGINQRRDLPEVPKPSRRPHSSSARSREGSTRSREGSTRSRDSSSSSESRHSRRQQNNDGEMGGEKPAVPKSLRKKKAKGPSSSSSSSSSSAATRDKPKADQDLDHQVDNEADPSLATANNMIKDREQENETQLIN